MTKAAKLAHAATALILVFVSQMASAQYNNEDPSGRVARLALTQGDVSFQPSGYDDWYAAQRNRPLTSGDRLWTDHNGLAELQLGGAIVQIGDYTSFSFLSLGDHATQIQLASGTMIVRVRRLDDDINFEVDTPNLAFTILRPGTYRISVSANGDSTTISVPNGYGEVTGGGTAYAVHGGERDMFTTRDTLYEETSFYAPDTSAFDRWSAQREARWEAARAEQRYVAAGVIGAEDLDDYGDWVPTPDYGTIWVPRGVDPDWAPYQRGHWAYIAPWGYTWIDDQPWGFAPFHYGRWVNFNGAWGWVPSPPPAPHAPYVRPVYAPALVAWVGVGINIGWFPLGPREVYVPAYHVSREYVNRVNVTNTNVSTNVVNNYYNTTIVNKTVNVTNVTYVNRTVRGAVSALPQTGFAAGQAVNRVNVQHGTAQLATAQVRLTAPAIAPTRQAVGVTSFVAMRPPAIVQSRTIVARIVPPPAPRASAAIILAGSPPNASQPIARVAPPATLRLPPAPPPARAPEVTVSPPAPRIPASPPLNRPVAPNANAFAHARDVPAPQIPNPNEANTALQREHFQQQQQLAQQQAQQRAKLVAQQEADHQRAVNRPAVPNLEALHQQQTQALQMQHAQQMQALAVRQQEQRQRTEQATKDGTRGQRHDDDGVK